MGGPRTIVLDCRWLGIGGPGRTTEFALRGLGQARPEGRWVLWGPARATSALAWPGTEVVGNEADPRLMLGQRHALRVPGGDFHVFMHQQRPLRFLPAANVIYDTIALRYGSGPAGRALKRVFLATIARTSRRILTISDHSRDCIVRDLGVPAGRIEVLRFPFDDLFVERVQAQRRVAAPAEVALFVGGFLPHKNLPRLIEAFGRTEFRRAGGRLVMVGASRHQAETLWAGLDQGQRDFVIARHSCTQAEIERLYATCRLVVQPSLEEGFGLPAWEALCCGIPVAVSDGGALPEVTHGLARPFPARSVAAMAAAIDECAARRDDGAGQSAALRAMAPSVEDFGRQFGQAVSGAAAGR